VSYSSLKYRKFLFFVNLVNKCASSPCQHGGTCENQVLGYTCTCKPGYSGNNCQTGMSIYTHTDSERKYRILELSSYRLCVFYCTLK